MRARVQEVKVKTRIPQTPENTSTRWNSGHVTPNVNHIRTAPLCG